jgi:dTDP-4-dehydrorhamnose reductase
MERILLIGSQGMLGRDLLPRLQEVFFPGVPGTEGVVAWDIGEIDIRQENETVEKIAALRPAVVVNAAAYTDVDGCEANPELAFAVNAEGVRHVALGAARCGARMVHLSTDYVFGGRGTRPCSEDDPASPVSVYGRSKWQGEVCLRETHDDHLIVRTQWLYGRHGKNFIAAILRQARERKTLSIVDDQTGSPTWTVDLSEAIVALLRRGARGTFHAANSGACTWYAFGKEILRLSGLEGIEVVPITSAALNRPAPRPAYSVLDTAKLARETGRPMRPWAEALREYLGEPS